MVITHVLLVEILIALVTAVLVLNWMVAFGWDQYCFLLEHTDSSSKLINTKRLITQGKVL